MKNKKKWIGFAAIVAVIGLAFSACTLGSDDDGTAYAIGGTGPGGGKIIYDKGNNDGGWRYLEAAPETMSRVTWSGTNEDLSTGTAIGAGRNNTAIIIAAHLGDTASNSAAHACVAYRGPNNKDDWFLPSKDELNEMFKARKHLGISTGDFWSSSQERDSRAWGQSFMNGNQWQNGKNEIRYFRPIRAF